MATSGVYQITNQVNGNRYIGSAVHLAKRWCFHLSQMRRGKHHNPHLQNAFDKYGEEAFTFSVLEDAEPRKLIEREQYYLDTIHPEYNMAPTAGSRLGLRHTDEARRKISEGNRGKHVSEETRRRISEAQKGKHLSAEHLSKMRQAWTPKRRQEQAERMRQIVFCRKSFSHTEKTKRKISEAHKGRIVSPEHRKKLSEALKGRRLSDETRRNMSVAQMGHPVSTETKQKLREAQTAYWARIRAAAVEDEG